LVAEEQHVHEPLSSWICEVFSLSSSYRLSACCLYGRYSVTLYRLQCHVYRHNISSNIVVTYYSFLKLDVIKSPSQLCYTGSWNCRDNKNVLERLPNVGVLIGLCLAIAAQLAGCSTQTEHLSPHMTSLCMVRNSEMPQDSGYHHQHQFIIRNVEKEQY